MEIINLSPEERLVIEWDDYIIAVWGTGEIPPCPYCQKSLHVSPDDTCKKVTHFYCENENCGIYHLSAEDNTISCDCEICGYFESIGA